MTMANLDAALKNLNNGVADSIAQREFAPLLNSWKVAFELMGIPVAHLQIPMSKAFGLQHPHFGSIVSIYSQDDGTSVMYSTHEQYAKKITNSLRQTPYYSLIFEDKDFC